MGSVLALDSFKKDFNIPTGSTGFASSENANISSNVVALLTAGCFFGAIAAAFANDKYGRRNSLLVLSVIFMVGAAVQTGGKGTIAYIYGGRVIAGFGIGGMSAITPVYVSENCPPNVRGRIAGLFQEFLVIGVTVSYWLCYGVDRNIPSSTRQWRIPVGFQLVPSGMMFVGLWFLKESPRWLMKQGRYDEATASLAFTRNNHPDSEEVQQELSEIRASIEEELQSTEGLTWRECLLPGNRLRFLNAFIMMFWQQFSGTNSIGYYAPQLFQTIGVAATDTSLFTTGIYGVVKVVATGIFLLIGIDRIGRKWSLVTGGIWMAAMMFVLGGVLVSYPPDPEANGNISSASIAMIVMVYLYVIGYVTKKYSHNRKSKANFLQQILRLLGPHSLGLHFRNLPDAPALLRCRDGICHAMALQLRRDQVHARSHQQHRMAHVHYVRCVLFRHGCLGAPYRQGDQGSVIGRHGRAIRRKSP